MSEWLTFLEAAEIAGVTVGQLCIVLSQSGCVDPPEELLNLWKIRRYKYIERPPNHPRVRVIAYMAVVYPPAPHEGLVTISALATGPFNAQYVDSKDLILWLADRSARMLAPHCGLCGDTGRISLPAIDNGYRLCPRCSREPHFPGRIA